MQKAKRKAYRKRVKLSRTMYDKMILAAEQAEACKEDLLVLSHLTPAEALAHENAPFWCRWYLQYAIDDQGLKDILRPTLEYVISRCPYEAYNYALAVLGERWIEGEATIMWNPAVTYWYATDVVKDRWPEAEHVIKQDEYFWCLYTRFSQELPGK